jgi:hypothetical protein
VVAREDTGLRYDQQDEEDLAPEGIAPERGAAPYASSTSTIPPVHTGQNAGSVIREGAVADSPVIGDAYRTPEPAAQYPPRQPEGWSGPGPAVDENRPADVVADRTGAGRRPNLLSREHAIADYGHRETAGEQVSEEEA